jgi:hypothetical protein
MISKNSTRNAALIAIASNVPIAAPSRRVGNQACPAISITGSRTSADPSSTPAPIAADETAGGGKIAAETFAAANMTGASSASRNHCQAIGSAAFAPDATTSTTPAKPNNNPSNPSQRKRSTRAATPIMKVNGGESASTSVITPAGNFGAI